MKSKNSRTSFQDSSHRATVVELINALGKGLKLVVPSPELPQGLALQALAVELSQSATRDNSCGSISECLKFFLGDDVDLDNVRIVTSGRHSFAGDFVIASGDAVVEVKDVGVVLALGKSKVFARNRVTVFGLDHSTSYMYDYTIGRHSGHSRVYAYDYSKGLADEWVIGVARNRACWKLAGGVFFDTHDNVVVGVTEDANLRAYGSTHVYGRDNVNVRLFDRTSGWFMDESKIELYGESTVYAEPTATVHRKSGASKHLPLARVFVALAAATRTNSVRAAQ